MRSGAVFTALEARFAQYGGRRAAPAQRKRKAALPSRLTSCRQYTCPDGCTRQTPFAAQGMQKHTRTGNRPAVPPFSAPHGIRRKIPSLLRRGVRSRLRRFLLRCRRACRCRRTMHSSRCATWSYRRRWISSAAMRTTAKTLKMTCPTKSQPTGRRSKGGQTTRLMCICSTWAAA